MAGSCSAFCCQTIEAKLQAELQEARSEIQAAQKRHKEELRGIKEKMNLLLEQREALQKQVSETAVAPQHPAGALGPSCFSMAEQQLLGWSLGLPRALGSMAAALKDPQCSAGSQLLPWTAGLVLWAVGQQPSAWIPAGLFLLALVWEVLFQVPLVGHVEIETSCLYALGIWCSEDREKWKVGLCLFSQPLLWLTVTGCGCSL